MISHILIRDFATIENTEVSFHKGLNVITGESGAGKSVIASAISLALGSRADTSYVRSGCDTATVQMIAEHNNREVVITRQVSTAGKNICRVDDHLVTLSELQEICNELADVHGQFDNQSLLRIENHLKLVDDYEKSAIQPVRHKLAEIYESYVDATRRLKQAKDRIENNDQRKELLTYQIDEINKAEEQLHQFDSKLKSYELFVGNMEHSALSKAMSNPNYAINKAYVLSNSNIRTQRTWTADELLWQINSLWAYSYESYD